MKSSKLLVYASVALLGLFIGACGTSAPERYYFLGLQTNNNSPEAQPVSDFAGAITLVVSGIPDSVDRPNLVMETGANELVLLENDRWSEPLKSGIERVLSESIARALPKSTIAASRKSVAPDAIRVSVRIDALRLTYDGNAIVDATWSISGSFAGDQSPHRATVVRAAGRLAPAELVKQWSQEFDEIGQQIAKSLDSATASSLR
jgi:uncharacterized lipoprotein YmbA